MKKIMSIFASIVMISSFSFPVAAATVETEHTHDHTSGYSVHVIDNKTVADEDGNVFTLNESRTRAVDCCRNPNWRNTNRIECYPYSQGAYTHQEKWTPIKICYNCYTYVNRGSSTWKYLKYCSQR